MSENQVKATRVLHLLNELKPSGGEIMLEAAGEMWANVHVTASILSVGAQLGDFSTRLAHAGYSLFHLPRRASAIFLYRLYQLFLQYDVIHIHTEHWNFIYGIIAKTAGCRVVRTIHNNFQYKGLTGFKLKWQRRLLRFIGVQHVAISKAVSENEIVFYKNESVVVNNWLSKSKFDSLELISRRDARALFAVPDNVFVITVIGNCSQIKNHSLLLNSLPEIFKKHNDVLLLHAGSGAAELEEKQLVKKLAITEKVKFLGNVSNIPALLKCSDLFVMPSLHEGFSIAVLEALYCGLPCALSSRPGLVGLDGEFSSVYYFELDANKCAAALSDIIENYADINLVETIEHNRNVVQHDYTPEAGCIKYASIYHQE